MKPKKILVVEDDQILQDFFREVLSSAGYEVLTAGSAVTAVNLARVEEPDLITLDISLSTDSSKDAWDGFSVVTWLRRLNSTKPPPIVVISGLPEPAAALRKASEAGVYTFLAKPIEREVLLKIIDEALRSQAAESVGAP